MYITQTDLQNAVTPDEFLQLFDRDKDGTADAAIVAKAIDAGENAPHVYLARRYALPLDTNDQILMKFLKPMIVDFAMADAYPRADMVPDDLQKRIDEHDAILADIRDGKADLPATSPPPASSTASSVIWSSSPRKFTRMP